MTAQPPRLQKLFSLDPMTRADLPAYLDMLGDPRVHQYLVFTPAENATIEGELGPKLDDQANSPAPAKILAVRDAGGRFAGMVALTDRKQPGTLELGFQLVPSIWGEGVATAAVRHMLTLAFERLAAEQVVAECYHTNTASQRVLEKSGLWITGIKRGAFEGGSVNQCRFGLTKAEYLRSRAVAAVTTGADIDVELSSN